jgi:BirA family transcriptional regulator, biotin operon repressor / biotin---[acetyl-CoA-carboxylase] ligase
MTIPLDITAEKIRALLTGRIIGRRLRVVAEIGSTNDAAMAAGRAGEPEGLAILADQQTGGRGRLGRSWASLPGLGVYTSILLRPPVPPLLAPLLTLMAGLATAEAIEAVGQVTPTLKWPNDVLCDGRKVAGILTEMTTMGQQIGQVAIGVGINVRHRATDFPADVKDTATSIELAAGRSVDRGEVAAALYNAMDRWYAVFCHNGTDTILRQARGRTATLGRPVTVLADQQRWRGIALDLDTDGALLVRDETGAVRRVIADDVSIR